MSIKSFGALFLFGILGAGCDRAETGPTPTTGSGTPTAGNAVIDVGECEGNPGYRSASEDSGTPAEPVVWVEAGAGGGVVVHLDDMAANCCPSPAATFETEGAEVSLTFADVSSTSSCDCMCVTDFVVTSEPLAAGEYTVEVEYNGAVQGTFPLTIP